MKKAAPSRSALTREAAAVVAAEWTEEASPVVQQPWRTPKRAGALAAAEPELGVFRVSRRQ